MAIDEKASDTPRGRVISQFKVFWNVATDKQVVVLQFPNRNRLQPYNRAGNLQPLQIRHKPLTGLIEVDVPLDTQARAHFNKEKALDLGLQLANNKIISLGGSFGLAGGFGAGGSAGNRRSRNSEDTRLPQDDPEAAYALAESRGHVLKTLTLAGKIQQFKEGDPIYAMATFKGDDIHLTRVDAICSLSPQYTHLDAATDNEKMSRIREADPGTSEVEARAVNVSMRSGDHENASPDDIGKTLRALQEEPFERMTWIDEEDEQAYLTFQDCLFYAGNSDRLVSAMSPSTYLDAISAPKVDNKTVGQMLTDQHKANVADDWDESTNSDQSDIEIMQEEGQRRNVSIK